jgi:multidrug transporter EmrE-like cation transporter
MTAKPTGLLLVAAAMAVESFAQMFLKIGAGGGPGILSQRFRDLAVRSRLGRTAGAWIGLGIAAYALEILLYTLALHRLDVSVAFPLGSLCFVGVAILSRWLLGEAVGPIRWLGVACILAGTVFLAL